MNRQNVVPNTKRAKNGKSAARAITPDWQDFLWKISILVTVALFLSAALFSARAQAYSGWSNSAKVFVNTTYESGEELYNNVYNAPMLVRLDSTSAQIFAEARSDGGDVRFAKSDESTALAYEIEQWDAANEKAAVWVKLDTIKSYDSTQYFMMYWGNPPATSAAAPEDVFDTADGLVGVWHLNDNLLDATELSRDGTNNGSADTMGIVGGGQWFNGSSDYISVGTFTPPDTGAVEAWVRLNQGSVNQMIVGGGSGFEMGINSSNYVRNGLCNAAGVDGYYTINTNQWHHIVASYNKNSAYYEIYVDGNYDNSSGATNSSPSGFDLRIGSGNASSFLNGAIDEVRVYKVPRDEDWSAFCYKSQYPGSKMIKIVTYWGPVWYVDSAAASGGDGSVNAPFDSFQEALAMCGAGDTIKVAQGTYSDYNGFSLRDSIAILGGYASGFSSRNYKMYKTIVTAENNTYDPVFRWNMYYSSDGYCIIDGFHITGGAEAVRIENNYQNNIIIRNNTIYYTTYPASGIHVDYCQNNVRIENNIFYYNSGTEIYVGDAKARIVNNTFMRGNSGPCIGLYSTSACSSVIMNNIFLGGSYGIQQNSMEDPDSILYNVFWGQYNAPYFFCEQPITLGELNTKDDCAQNKSIHPMFVDTLNRNFHLRTYSRCIDAGHPLSPYANEPANNGGRINLGAYGNTIFAQSRGNGGPSWYVDSANGSNSGDGSKTQPFDSLEYAFWAARPGDTIKVAKGSFYKSSGYVLPDSLTLMGGYNSSFSQRIPDSLFTILGKTDGSGNVVELPHGPQAQGYCEIDGFVITGGGEGIYVASNYQKSIVIRNNYIRNNAYVPKSGIHIDSSSAAITIMNNILTNNGNTEIYIDSARARIINNTIVCQSTASAVYLDGGAAVSSVIMNNIFYKGAYGIQQAFAGSLDSAIYNSFWGQSSSAYRIGQSSVSIATLNTLGDSKGNDSLQPVFVNAGNGDYHQHTSSKCLDAGNPASDYFLEPADNGGRINLGAFGNTLRATGNKYAGPVWHVNASASAGGNGSRTSPFNVINLGTFVAYPGDTIKVAQGNYAVNTVYGSMSLNKNHIAILGGYSNDFSIRNADSLNSIIVDSSGASNLNGIIIEADSGGVVDGFLFKDFGGKAIKVYYNNDAKISNSRFYSCSRGIYAEESINTSIANNVFAHDSIGVETWYHCDSLEVINNTFANNIYYGLCYDETFAGKVENNIFAFNKIAGIEEGTMYGQIEPISFNSFYSNGTADFRSDAADVTLAQLNSRVNSGSNLSLAPNFVDTSALNPNFHLTYGSPCIDAGDPAYAYANEPGEPYTGGARINLGAYGNTQWAQPKSDITPPVVSSSALLSPNGGELYRGGQSVTITWDPSAVSDNDRLKNMPVSLHYAFDADANFDSVIISGFPNSGSATWTVPQISTAQVLVRLTITDSMGNAAYDYSEGYFQIDSDAPQGTIAIADMRGVTADVDPRLTITSASADSMRFSASDAFKPYAAADSVNISSGGDGQKIVSVQFKDKAGNVSGWFSDTTWYDITGPGATFVTTGQYDKTNWPGSIAGTTHDEKAGVNTVYIAVRNQTTGYFYNGRAWRTDTSWLPAVGTVAWSLSIADSVLSHGSYTVMIIAVDSVGNSATATVADAFTYISEAPVASFTATPVSGVSPLTVSFTDTTTGLVTGVTWLFGDTAIAGTVGGTVSYTYAKPGKYDVGLTAIGPGGSNTVTKDDYIYVINTAPVVVAPADTQIYEKTTWTATATATDHDKDYFVFALSRPPAGMTIDTASGAMSWSPGAGDVGTHTVVVRCFDANAGASVDTFSITVLDVNDAPQTYLTRTRTVSGAARFAVRGSDDYDSVLTFAMSLTDALGSAVVDTQRSALRADTLLAYPLVDGTYIFTCFVIDSKGLADSTPVKDTIVIKGTSAYAYADTAGWHLASVPALSIARDSLARGGKIARWDESAPKREIYNYYLPSSEIKSITAGQSCWRKSATPAAISLSKQMLATGAVSIPLSKAEGGWNQIACPYIYPVKWPKGGTLWKWNAATRDYEADNSGMLVPWGGYWYMAAVAETVVVQPQPVFTSATTAKRAKAFFVDRDNWRIQFVLQSGMNIDADNVIGFSRDASQKRDALDLHEPPRMPGQSYVFISHPEWNYGAGQFASDIRYSFDDEVNAFELGIVTGSQQASDIVLRANGIDELEGIYMFIGDQDGIERLVDENAVSIEPSDNVQYKTVWVTADRNFMAKIPRTFAMPDAYPNPARSAITLRYTLPFRWETSGRRIDSPYDVSMKIYDAQGRVSRNLVSRKQDAGHYAVVWDGKSNTGRMVSAGAYVCMLQAGGFNSMRRLVIVR